MDLEVYAQKWGVTKEYLMTNDFFVVAKKDTAVEVIQYGTTISTGNGFSPG